VGQFVGELAIARVEVAEREIRPLHEWGKDTAIGLMDDRLQAVLHPAPGGGQCCD
jgi:hypothetical protein